MDIYISSMPKALTFFWPTRNSIFQSTFCAHSHTRALRSPAYLFCARWMLMLKRTQRIEACDWCVRKFVCLTHTMLVYFTFNVAELCCCCFVVCDSISTEFLLAQRSIDTHTQRKQFFSVIFLFLVRNEEKLRLEYTQTIFIFFSRLWRCF